MLYQNFSSTFRQVATIRKVVLANAFAAIFLLAACGSSQTDDVVCTTEARASVMLTVVDTENNKLPDVSVTYSIDKSSPKTQICTLNNECILEYEVPGEFSITASKAGYFPESATVKVTRSVCHVNTERVTLTLKKAA
jgi:hypothetical protein